MRKTDQPHIPLVVTVQWLAKEGIGSRTTIWRKLKRKEFPTPDARRGNRMAWRRDTVANYLREEGMLV